MHCILIKALYSWSDLVRSRYVVQPWYWIQHILVYRVPAENADKQTNGIIAHLEAEAEASNGEPIEVDAGQENNGSSAEPEGIEGEETEDVDEEGEEGEEEEESEDVRITKAVINEIDFDSTYRILNSYWKRLSAR